MNPTVQTPTAPSLTLRDCTINIRIGGRDYNSNHTRWQPPDAPLSSVLETVERTSTASGAAEHTDASESPFETSPYIKFNADGNVMPDGATNHAGVLDRTTGLMWSNTLGDQRLTHAEAEKACADLRLAGHDDWRLPTRQELQTILDLSRHDPAVDPDLFPDTKSEAYWSGSRLAAYPDCAWLVNFLHGHVARYPRHGNARVRAVRVASLPASQ